MDIHYEKNGVTFIWNYRKAAANPNKHDGITFEQAAEAFFDLFLSWSMRAGNMKRVMR